jgi:hypothetical protein
MSLLLLHAATQSAKKIHHRGPNETNEPSEVVIGKIVQEERITADC